MKGPEGHTDKQGHRKDTRHDHQYSERYTGIRII